VAGRLGDVERFRNASAVRSFVGMIPGTDQSGEAEGRPGVTKAGDRLLRTSLWLAADHARRMDPQLAQIYYRQMVDRGNHHTKAVCAVTTALVSRLAAILREGRSYVVRDTDGRPVDSQTANRIIAERYTVSAELRASRRRVSGAKRMKGRLAGGARSKASPPSPPSGEASLEDATQVLVEA
jgi:Transposase IS116/IS110/IS902 family